MNNSKIVVVGGLGFIGYHFSKFCLSQNHQIFIVDDLNYPGNAARLINLVNLGFSTNNLLLGDLSSPKDIYSNIMEDCEIIINFASISNVDISIKYPTHIIQTNLSIMSNILESIINSFKKLKCLIHISTDEVYGESLKVELNSSNEKSQHKPSNPYAASKSAQEALCWSYANTYNVPILILNLSNNFGPIQNNDKFIPCIIKSLKNNKPIKAFTKNGNWGFRSWMYVENQVDALYFLINQVLEGKINLPNQFITGSQETFFNSAIVRIISELMNKEPNVIYGDNFRPGIDLGYCLDDSKFRELGWKPKISWQEGLERTIKFYDNIPIHTVFDAS